MLTQEIIDAKTKQFTKNCFAILLKKIFHYIEPLDIEIITSKIEEAMTKYPSTKESPELCKLLSDYLRFTMEDQEKHDEHLTYLVDIIADFAPRIVGAILQNCAQIAFDNYSAEEFFGIDKPRLPIKTIKETVKDGPHQVQLTWIVNPNKPKCYRDPSNPSHYLFNKELLSKVRIE